MHRHRRRSAVWLWGRAERPGGGSLAYRCREIQEGGQGQGREERGRRRLRCRASPFQQAVLAALVSGSYRPAPAWVGRALERGAELYSPAAVNKSECEAVRQTCTQQRAFVPYCLRRDVSQRVAAVRRGARRVRASRASPQALAAGLTRSRDEDIRTPTLHTPHHITQKNHSLFKSSTAMKASCGTLTLPMAFIRFLPSACFFKSFFLRETSPP